MRPKYFLAIVLLAALAQAKEPKHFQSGKLLKMQSVKCGTDEKNGKSVAGEMLGTDSSHMKTHELLCQEYVLETDNLVYTIRPKDDKHPALLPVGEKAQFRLDKDKMRSEEHTSELQSHLNLVCRLLLEKKKSKNGKLCEGATCMVQL